MTFTGDQQTNITNNPAFDRSPKWSPNGNQIVFFSDRDGNGEVYVMDADGTNVTRLTNNLDSDGSPGWSSDGSKILFSSSRDGNAEIYLMDAVDTDGDGNGDNLTRLTNNPATDGAPDWSPGLVP